jgi:tetratricopeptide (TPR) repeat protein
MELMRQRLLARTASFSILTVWLGATSPAFADDAPKTDAAAAPQPPTEAATKEARDHYEAGLALYSDGEFQRAAIEFDRAYELVPNYRALYNIGQVRIQLHNYARAMKALQAYLKEGGSKIDAERKKSVNDDLEMLSTRTALLTIESNEDGAEVMVDGEVAGTTPLAEPLLLDTGDHRIGMRKPGFVARENSITLASRDALSMRIDIQKEELSKPMVVVAPTTPAADRTAWIWGTWSATAALAVGAGVTGGLGIKAANELDDKRSTLGSTRDELDSAQSRAQTLLNTSTVLGVGAIVTGSIALYLTLSKPAGAEKPKKRAELRVGPTSVNLVGQF